MANCAIHQCFRGSFFDPPRVDAAANPGTIRAMKTTTLSRRNALKTLGLGMPFLAAGGLKAHADSHKEAPIPARKGWFYRHPVGGVEVTVLTDGAIQFPPHPTFGGEMATKEEVHAVLKAHYRDTERVNAELNLCLVDDGKTRTLIDTGYGERAPATAGRLLASLQLAGYQPADIDRIVITHAHPDHLYGLTQKDGTPVFPNARVLIHGLEKAFWSKTEAELAAMKTDGNRLAGMVQNINDIFSQLGDRLETNSPGARLDDTLTLVDLHGHTPGHQGVMVESDGSRLLVLGDTANNEILMTAEPDWPFGFDNDPKQTALTRRDIFGKVADQRIEVLAYHWSVPGLAHIGRDGDAFRWHPSPMKV